MSPLHFFSLPIPLIQLKIAKNHLDVARSLHYKVEMIRTALLLLFLQLIPTGSAWAVEYGVSAGLGIPVDPLDPVGLVGGVSAVFPGEGSPPALLRVRGELIGLLSTDSKAVLPTLVGDLGLPLGPMDIFFTGGVQLFGVAWRADYTVFTTLGFTGGVGLSWKVHSTRLILRGTGTYIPSALSAILDQSPGAPKPTFAFLSILFGVELDVGDPRTIDD